MYWENHKRVGNSGRLADRQKIMIEIGKYLQLNKWLKGREVCLNFIFYVSTSNSLVLSGI